MIQRSVGKTVTTLPERDVQRKDVFWKRLADRDGLSSTQFAAALAGDVRVPGGGGAANFNGYDAELKNPIHAA